MPDRSPQPPTITIISPCYNDKANVEACYQAVKRVFDQELSHYQREHIFADNASTDGSDAVLRALAAADPRVKVIFNARNYGVVRSTFHALKASSGDATLVMLAVDLQDPPELLPKFVALWREGWEVVQGVRSERQEPPLFRYLRHRFYAVMSAIADIEISPDVGDFQLIDRKVLNHIRQFDDHFPYIRGLIAYSGFKTTGFDYILRARASGISKHRLYNAVDLAANALLTYSRKPLRVMVAVGAVLFVCGLLGGLATGLAWLVGGGNGTATLAALITLLAGVQMLFGGMLGEYLMLIHGQTRFGSLLAERERLNFT